MTIRAGTHVQIALHVGETIGSGGASFGPGTVTGQVVEERGEIYVVRLPLPVNGVGTVYAHRDRVRPITA